VTQSDCEPSWQTPVEMPWRKLL